MLWSSGIKGSHLDRFVDQGDEFIEFESAWGILTASLGITALKRNPVGGLVAIKVIGSSRTSN